MIGVTLVLSWSYMGVLCMENRVTTPTHTTHTPPHFSSPQVFVPLCNHHGQASTQQQRLHCQVEPEWHYCRGGLQQQRSSPSSVDCSTATTCDTECSCENPYNWFNDSAAACPSCTFAAPYCTNSPVTANWTWTLACVHGQWRVRQPHLHRNASNVQKSCATLQNLHS